MYQFFIAELDDVMHELENQRTLCTQLEKKQRQFDKQLQEERQIAGQRAEERDQAQSAARAAEAKVNNLQMIIFWYKNIVHQKYFF